MQTREERVEFIKNQNIPIFETPDFTLDKILKWALIKDISLNRIGRDDVDCFGYCDEQSEICQKCFLFVSRSCVDFSSYLQQLKELPHSNDVITVVEWFDNQKGIKVMSLENSLERLHFRSNDNLSYKIAKIMLTSNDAPYGEVIQKIAEIINASTHEAQVRFYQIRKRIHEHLGLKISIVTTKHIQIKEEKK